MGYFETARILLRALEPEDLEVICAWENDSEMWRYGSTVRPFSRYDIRKYIAESRTTDIVTSRQLRLMVVEKSSTQATGAIDLYEYDPLNMRAGVGILIDKKFQRLGYASDAITLIHKYASNRLGLHSLFVHVPQSNLSSLNLFNSCGYKQTGVLKDWLRINGLFEDVIVMQYFF